MLSRVLLAASAAALVIAAPAVAGPGGHGGGGGGGPHGGGGGDPHGGGGGGPHGGGGGGPHGGGPPAFAAPGGGGHGGGPRGGGPQGFAPRSGGGGRHGGAEMTFSGAGFRGGHGHGGEGSAVGRGAGRARGGYGPAMMASRRGAAGGGHGASGAHNNHYASGRGYGRQQRREFARTQQFHGSRNHEVRMARSERGGRSGGQRFSNSSPGWASRQMRASGVRRQSAFGGPGSGRPAPGMQQAYRGGVMSAGPQQRVTAPQQFGIQHLGRHADALAGANYPNVGGANQAWGGSPYDRFTYANNVQVLPVTQVQRFIGSPIGQAATVVPLAPIPTDLSYLYPATPDYYYEWGDGYLYQVDRSDNLIAALIPLLAGGYLPGQYLPAAYMANPVPADYGLDSFYPDEGDLCSRYYQGVVYEVDCGDGYVEEVAPMYAGGYGVGQLLPASYSYYNVPAQYRSIYYDTPDSGYWYSPGAIYRFDPRTSVITSVAALMAPGFSVGQPLPPGYDVYNIPLDYRATYYDTPSAWYRYNNGYIYQVDPVTQLVTAVVASLLT